MPGLVNMDMENGTESIAIDVKTCTKKHIGADTPNLESMLSSILII